MRYNTALAFETEIGYTPFRLLNKECNVNTPTTSEVSSAIFDIFMANKFKGFHCYLTVDPLSGWFIENGQAITGAFVSGATVKTNMNDNDIYDVAQGLIADIEHLYTYHKHAIETQDGNGVYGFRCSFCGETF